MGRKQKKFGFTLLEVLIALVVVSVAFAAVINALGTNARTIVHLRQSTAANWVASNVLTQVELGLITNQTAGFEVQLGRRYYWEIGYESTPNPSVRNVNVVVKLTEQGSPILTLNGFQGVSDEQQ